MGVVYKVGSGAELKARYLSMYSDGTAVLP